jgi:Zn-finger nucleic acid-binding protein
MNCPACGHAMDAKVKRKLAIDECRSCGSLWFDSDEFRKIKDAIDPDLNWMDFEFWKHEDQFILSEKARLCPRCRIRMVLIRYGSTPVDVDYCPKCKGTLLDRGEFGKIIRSLERELLAKNVGDYWPSIIEEAKEIFSGGEGVISEWKDFTAVLKMMHYRFFAENPRLASAIQKAQAVSPIH